MKNYKKILAEAILSSGVELELDEIEAMIEAPKDETMGDYAFPCFRLAKVLRKAPQIIAEELAKNLIENSIFDKVENVGGYVNVHIPRADFISGVIDKFAEEGEKFFESNEGNGKKVIVEFSSPNIAKPFHIGHIRSTVIGNSINNLYKTMGYDVVRINHLGDYGTQFGKMICAYRKWGNEEDVKAEPIKTLLKYYTKFHEEAEKNPELEDEAREIFVKLENGEKEEVALWQWFRDESLKEFSRVYNMLGIEFDSYAGESFYSDKMDAVLDELNAKNLLEESKGAMIVDLEKYDMTPALVKKSDGSTLYITRDIAAAIYRKNTYDFYKNIYVVASQQNLHFQQWFKIIELMGYDWAKDCYHVPFGLVSLKEGTMSTRKGRVVFLEDVLNGAVEKTKTIIEEKGVSTEDIDEVSKKVGIGAVVFNELANNRIKDYVFDWDKVLNFDGETGPYVQYTYARGCSLMRKAGEKICENIKANPLEYMDCSLISDDESFAVVKLIYNMNNVIKDATDKHEPSVLTRYIVDIAQAFNRFYNKKRVVVEDEKQTASNIAIVYLATCAIKKGLSILGIEAPERM